MTVQDNPNTIDYLGNDVQLSFAFTFRADDVSWIDLSFTADLDQISLNADQDTSPGGSVVYSVAPPTAQLIRITRIVPQDQDLDYTRYDAFDSESHEDALDKLTMEIQDLHEIIGGFTNTPLLPIGTIDQSILRWSDANQLWQEFITYIFPLIDGAAGQAIVTDGAGSLGFASIVGAIDDGTVDGQMAIWDVGADQWQPVAVAALQFNPATPPTSPLGKFSGNGGSTTDVRKAFTHINIGASVGSVWSTDRNGGTPSGFYSRSAFNGAQDIHDWGYWNPANQTGISNFRITEDNEFILDHTAFMAERAAALPDIAGHGQFWWRDDGTPMGTDDLGVDYELNLGSAAGTNGAKVFNSVSQAISDNTETVVVFGGEAYDDNSFHAGGSPSRLTIPTGVTRFRLTGQITWPPNGSSFRRLEVRKNGVNNGAIDDDMTAFFTQIYTSAANASVPNVGVQFDTGIIRGVATDFYEVVVFHNAGVVLSLVSSQNWFQIEVIE